MPLAGVRVVHVWLAVVTMRTYASLGRACLITGLHASVSSKSSSTREERGVCAPGVPGAAISCVIPWCAWGRVCRPLGRGDTREGYIQYFGHCGRALREGMACFAEQADHFGHVMIRMDGCKVPCVQPGRGAMGP